MTPIALPNGAVINVKTIISVKAFPRRTSAGTEFCPSVAVVIGTDKEQAMTDQEKLAKALEALADIARMTNVDDPESYRCDDREGCLDTVFDTATKAVAELST